MTEFMKGEPYQKLTDPRAIQMPTQFHKLEYSRYLYPIYDWMGQQPWYAFHKGPREFSESVARICRSATTILEDDWTRWDGHKRQEDRDLERALLIAMFEGDDLKKVLQLHEKTFGGVAKSSFGDKFELGYAQCSGLMDTSAFNSIVHLFRAYVAYRVTLESDRAWDYILRSSLVGGDDGIFGDLPEPSLQFVANMYEGKVKLSTKRRGDTVCMLSRIFGPTVWFGDSNNMGDVRRRLSNFHMTANQATDVACFHMKASGYAYTDPETPLLRDLAMLSNKPDAEDVDGYHGRWAKENGNFPNSYEPWMDMVIEQQMPGFDRGAWATWVELSKQGILLNAPVCWVKQPDIDDTPCVLSGLVSKVVGNGKHPAAGKPPPLRGDLAPLRNERKRPNIAKEKAQQIKSNPKGAECQNKTSTTYRSTRDSQHAKNKRAGNNT
jgi:hypothetical protein